LVSLLLLFPRDVAAIAVVPEHLLSLAGNTGTHGGEPPQHIKGLLAFKNLRTLKSFEKGIISRKRPQ